LPLASGGCALVDSLRGDGFRELEPDWGEGFRPLGKPGEAYGMSSKARQIERNLGVQ
jgi:hypothetical protein